MDPRSHGLRILSGLGHVPGYVRRSERSETKLPSVRSDGGTGEGLQGRARRGTVSGVEGREEGR
jgi:hypothetical protein